MTCTATTRKGNRCRRPAVDGLDVCQLHAERKPGTGLLLTDATADRIAGLLRAGNYDAVAARAVGVSPRTLRDWLQRGRTSTLPTDDAYRDLAERVDRARAEGEALHVTRIVRAAEDDWHASAWFLERSYPERWGRVSPRPADSGRHDDDVVEPVSAPTERGVFSEVDELARKRQARER